MSSTKTYPGADTNFDLMPVIYKLKIKLKVPIKPKVDAKLDMDALKKERSKTKFSIEASNNYDMLAQEEEEQTPEEEIDTIWESFKRSLVDLAKNIVPTKKEREAKGLDN